VACAAKPTTQLTETLTDTAVALENAISVTETEPGYADNLALRELVNALRRARHHLTPYVANYPTAAR
jgi:hypothetical protein